MEGYEIITGFVVPAYSYIEGDKKEHYWLDSQNCYFHLVFDITDARGKRKDGKKYWIIEPFKPEEITITKENYEQVKNKIKWLVNYSSEDSDEEEEWDFVNHCVYGKDK